MALTGTLADVPIDELAALIQQQQRTGLLQIKLDGGEVEIHFREGMICQVDDEIRPASQRIGELLVAAGKVSREDVASALEEQRAEPKPLGAILVSRGLLSMSDLFTYLHLQFRESLFPLFTLTEGSFEFDAEGFVPRKFSPPSIPVEDVAMEAMRRLDELPELREWVPSPHTRFRRADDAPAEFPEDPPDRCGLREHKIFDALTEDLDAETLIGPTALSLFDNMKGLANLFRAGLIAPTDRRAWSESAMLMAVPKSAQSVFRRHPVGSRVLLQMLTTALLGFSVLALIISKVVAGPAAEVVGAGEDERFELLTHLSALQTAAEIYFLEEGQYPNDLTSLAEGGFLSTSFGVVESESGNATLTSGDYQQGYFYRTTPRGFVLLPPKR